MTNKEIEQRLRAHAARSVPDLLDNILSECEKQEGAVIKMEELAIVRKKNRAPLFLGAAAAAVIACAGIISYGFMAKSIDSIVALDVNPSVELNVNRFDKVIEASAKNTDAEKILGGMNLKNTDLEVAVNAVIGSMLKNGYIDELSNSVLITVENQDAAKSEQLKEKLVNSVGEILANSSIEPAILSQTITPQAEQELKQSAEISNISAGRAALIQKLAAANPALSVADLSGLTVNELNLLSQAKSNKLDDIEVSGKASTAAYINVNTAKSTALEHAGVKESAVERFEIELDWDDGRMVYEMEWRVGKAKFKYDVDALTAEIISFERFDDKDNNANENSAASNYVGKQAAIDAALTHAGVRKSDINKLKTKFDIDDGKALYEVEFTYNSLDYEYKIDALTARVISFEQEGGFSSSSSSADSFIGKDKALSIAFADCGLKKSNVSRTDISLDDDDGVYYYDISFYHNGSEYEYDIDASTGKILSRNVDNDDDDDDDDGIISAKIDISRDKALSLALSYAGITGNVNASIKLDDDDGSAVYDIEFKHGGAEYSLEIDASTGKVISFERDSDDDDDDDNDDNVLDKLKDKAEKEAKRLEKLAEKLDDDDDNDDDDDDD